MKKDKFEKLKEKLLSKGYKVYHQNWHHEDYVIGNSFHVKDNIWEEDRSSYQILLSIYDYTIKDYRVPKDLKDKVGIEIHIDVSRTVSERIDMVISWHEDTTIEEVEDIAESYYQWIKLKWPEPREEKEK